jgi:phosphoglycerate dehydrogenase-like enzyme
MISNSNRLNVLITSYLEPEYVEKIRQVDPRINVIFEPGLIAAPRYAADHGGSEFNRSPEDEKRWLELLAGADILFDFDQTHRKDLPDVARRVRWVQSTSTGIGQFVHRMEYDKRMPETIFTMAGVHARPLAEFAVMAALMHYKRADLMEQQKREKRFERFSGTEVEGRTMAVLGLGRIGTAVAELAKANGMHVLGMDLMEKSDVVDRYYKRAELDEMLPLADVVVATMPDTPLTRKMIGAHELAIMKKGAYLVNIARGSVIDESALVAALQSGHLGGAGLDVFEVEPLPQDSPLWDMPNVLICPHSASTSDRENGRITEVFCDNLHRYLDGQPLRNVLNPDLMY